MNIGRHHTLLQQQIWTTGELEEFRAHIIEECARVAEQLRTPFSEYNWAYEAAAAAIRALKDKP